MTVIILVERYEFFSKILRRLGADETCLSSNCCRNILCQQWGEQTSWSERGEETETRRDWTL